jgi:hypothetical protein
LLLLLLLLLCLRQEALLLLHLPTQRGDRVDQLLVLVGLRSHELRHGYHLNKQGKAWNASEGG